MASIAAAPGAGVGEVLKVAAKDTESPALRTNFSVMPSSPDSDMPAGIATFVNFAGEDELLMNPPTEKLEKVLEDHSEFAAWSSMVAV